MPFRALYFKSIKFGTLSTTDPVSSCVVPFAFPFSYASRIIQMTNVGNVSTAGPFLLFHIKSGIRHMYEIWCNWKNKNILNMFLSLFAFVCQNSKCIQLLRKRFAKKTRKTQKMMLACVGSTPLHNYFRYTKQSRKWNPKHENGLNKLHGQHFQHSKISIK